MANKARILPNYTYEDYVRWEGRWEIIDGIPYAMSPSPNSRHQRIAARLIRILGNALDNDTCHCEPLDAMDIKVSENTILQPDIVVVCDEEDGPFLSSPPELVVEILSPSTRLKDLNTKYLLYQDFGIQYYVIVDPDDNSIRILRRNKEGVYEDQEGHTFTFHEGCNIALDFNPIW